MTKQFEKSARYYDIFYRNRDYAADTRELEAWIDLLCPRAQDILDVACGSHEHGQYFDQKFKVDGVDLNDEFLLAAAQKNADRRRSGAYFSASMDAFDLDRQYDVVLCLFSSIAYLPDAKALTRAIGRFASHLAPGGVIMIEPWLSPEDMERFEPVQMVRDGTTHVARMTSYSITGSNLSMSLHYMVHDGSAVHHFCEDHQMRFFQDREFEQAFGEAGLVFHKHTTGLSSRRGLYVAVPLGHAQAKHVAGLCLNE